MRLTLLFTVFFSLISVSSASPFPARIHWTNSKKTPTALKIIFRDDSFITVELAPGQNKYTHTFENQKQVSGLYAMELTWSIKRRIFQIRRGSFFRENDMDPPTGIYLNITPEEWRKQQPPSYKANL